MRKILPIILFTIFCLMVPAAYAEPTLSFELSPEPLFDQVWAYETYQVNMSVQDLNLSSIDFSGYQGEPAGLIFQGEIQWKGKGGYDFGTGTTGYNYNLDKITVEETASIDESAFLNITLEKDAYEYGRLPFETLQIVFKIDAYVVMSDDSLGPKIATKTRTFVLIDEMKTAYLEGKYLNMEEEINIGIEALGLRGFNREKYNGIIEAMNNSLTLGNYVEALDIWDDYDEDDRTDMISSLVRASNTQYNELEELKGIEDQLGDAEIRISILELEYSQLESTYNALSGTYLKVNAELEVAKRNLTTVITAVFLTAIVFYFLGRRGIRREEAERLDEPDIY